MSHEIGSDLRKWDAPSVAFFLKKRWWKRNVDPVGPSGPMITEAGSFMETESGVTMVTEGV